MDQNDHDRRSNQILEEKDFQKFRLIGTSINGNSNFKDFYNIPSQCMYNKILSPSRVQKTIHHNFDVTTMLKK